MSYDELISSAVNLAYQAQVKGVYNAFSEAILGAKGAVDKIEQAEEKFKQGMSHAYELRRKAIILVGAQE